MSNDYKLAHDARKKDAEKLQSKNSITFDSPGVVDESGDKLPAVPKKPLQPQLPIDDPFKKMRTNQA